MPIMLQISDFGISDRYCHHRSYNYIIIPRKLRKEEKEGGALPSANLGDWSASACRLEVLSRGCHLGVTDWDIGCLSMSGTPQMTPVLLATVGEFHL